MYVYHTQCSPFNPHLPNDYLNFTYYYYRELLRQPDVKLKYQFLITNSFVLDNPNLRWCPAAGCPNAVLANSREDYPVKCDCGHSFWWERT